MKSIVRIHSGLTYTTVGKRRWFFTYSDTLWDSKGINQDTKKKKNTERDGEMLNSKQWNSSSCPNRPGSISESFGSITSSSVNGRRQLCLSPKARLFRLAGKVPSVGKGKKSIFQLLQSKFLAASTH